MATASHDLVARAASGAGSHTDQGSSLSALVSTLIPFFVIAAVLVAVFIIAQKFYKRVYVPRTFLETLYEYERTPKQQNGLRGAFAELSRLRDEFLLGHTSLDNYLWLRFFKMLTLMSFVGCLITWPILFPVNITGGGGQSGLDILSFSNVNPGPRVLAHCFVAWIFLAFVMFLISRETLYFVHLRQAYFLSPFVQSRISTRTVLFMDVPESYRNERRLRQMYTGVRHAWILKDTDEIEDDVEDRDNAAYQLETGESALIMAFVKGKLKSKGQADDNERQSLEVNYKDRPTHKLKPIIGKKVDTINYSRGELQRLVPHVFKEQNKRRSGDWQTKSAMFVEFETVAAAQAAFQQTAHGDPLRMTPQEIGMTPDQVIWKNLGKPWALRKVMQWASTAFVMFLCLFWTIPVALVGVISNIDSLISQFSWLSWLNAIPDQIMGVVTGLLPTILLVILMALVPIVCNLLGGLFEPTQAAVQLRTQSWYFVFQVIQVFLITTFSSGAASVGAKIAQDPSLAATLLAKNLPKASNFYIAYLIYFGLLQAALQLLNIAPLLFFALLGNFTDKTPRKKYNRYSQLGGLTWGAFYPKFTNLGVIAISYSAIAPLVLGFATLGFLFLYMAFRYNVFFTLGTTVDTKGRAYARALQQLTVGIYLSELCLIGLFGTSTGGSIVALAALVLMVIFLIGTIIWHVQMRKILGQLTSTLPADLLAEKSIQQHEQPHDEQKHRSGQHTNGFQHSPNHRADQHSPNYRADQHSPNYRADQHSPNYKNEPKMVEEQGQISQSEAPPAPTGIMGRAKAFFMPNKFASAEVLSKRVFSHHLDEPVRPYTEEEELEAYMHPALVSECPVVWIPKDDYGLSKREIADTRAEVGEGCTITDADTWVDEKGNLQWKQSHVATVPIREEQVIY